ncbi:Mutanase [Colletotrichum higginsianum]|uniref:Mutanase n=1 Tax=Colletotrichum higginsianum TaxID=80884 RepID=A0A4T0W660_9PEZI|nr:Mutanase [Colletotrichum higginsianum]
MVGNTEHYSGSDWIDDIKLAQEAHIDAFALNMARGEPMNAKAIADAFSNAEAQGFKLFFSFDYAGRGPFSKDEVVSWINKYAPSSAYFRHQGKPFVSTFEGPDQAEDWHDIKAITNCFFVPDWSSLGAGPAMEFQPYDIIDDSVFFTVLATESVKVTVSIGGAESQGVLRDLPDGGVGLYHGSAPFNGRTGDVKITVWRKDVLIADQSGPAIKNDCRNGITGFDAWAGGRLTSKASRPVSTPSLEDEVCVRGTGANDFDVICRATCYLGYCPKSACVCRATGAQVKLPPEVPGEVFPAEGLNSNYIGLCNFACLYGACFSSYCGKTKYPLIEPTVSPFNPPSCTSGTGDGDWSVLCNFACRHGFCPISRCKCTSQGPLSLLNPTQQTKAVSRIGEDHGLCAFACSRGLCPKQACDANDGEQQEQTNPPVDQIEMPHLDRDCYMFPECVDLDNPQVSSCSSGHTRVSFDRGSCSGRYGRPICCKNTVLPLKCTWRGSGADCNGQCHKGEVTLFESRTGGNPGESGDTACNRGHKTFCCELKIFKELTSQCRWTECSGGCTSDESLVAQRTENSCLLATTPLKYCCKNSPPPLSNCHWVGQGDCADNNCNNKEVTLLLDSVGLLGGACAWWRQKTLCCTPEEAVLGNGQCPAPSCTSEAEEGCAPDEWGSDQPEDDCEDDDCEHDELRRDVMAVPQDFSLAGLAFEERSLLEARGEKRRPFEVHLIDLLMAAITIKLEARRYPGSGSLHDQPGASDNVFQ